MFDFLIKYPISIFEIKEFLAVVLNYPFDKVLVVSSERVPTRRLPLKNWISRAAFVLVHKWKAMPLGF